MHSGRTARLITALAALVAAQPLAAQKKPATSAPPTAAAATPAAPHGTSEIRGILIDSLNSGFLAGAEVIIEGAKAQARSDSLGRFRIDSLLPGDYQVGVFHPLLDTLGLSLATRPFHLGADSSSLIVLAVPSAESIIKRACPVRPRAHGTSAVIGHVTDPETLQPVAGAEVSIAWSELEASKETGVRRTPRVIWDSTDANGNYRLCGLPNSMEATLQAKRGGSLTAEIPISLGDRDSELFARILLLSSADSTTKVGNATVSGRVVLQGSPTNGGSRVEVVGTDQVVMTNEKGEFTITKLPSGSHVLLARHLGFGAQTVAVDLSPHQAQRVTIQLPKFVATIAPVIVNAKSAAGLDKVGFSQRQKSGMGFYLGPERIKEMHPQYLTDILRVVPSLRVSSTPTGDVVTSSRGIGGSCVQYYVDDSPWQSATPGDINQFVNANEVVAAEVYQASDTPAQYTMGGMGGCTTIVLWTRFKIRDK
jgi:carboxypeptidase family protein/TonB-dependent receptor-like protein